MKLVPVKEKGRNLHYAMVDDEDYEMVIQHVWYAHRSHKKGITAAIGKIDGKTVYMHRLILGVRGKGIHTDHKDRNPLNNQKENLRTCTIAENNFNRLRENNTSKYKGVYKNTRKNLTKPYSVKIQFEGIRLNVSETFETEEEAAKVHDILAKKLHGEFALLNFPD